ncbi:hypothetical protein [Aurantibacter sp.]|uniref:hypothetical protein n=1 Tax=Aurantibacter sp. TaxID=2807103 RepID=UPI003267859A
MVLAPIRELELNFAKIYFYETYVVCKIKDHTIVDTAKVISLHEVYREFYGQKKYGYIFDRTANYTINIIAYMHCPFYSDVSSFAMVAPNEETKKTIKYEEIFSLVPLRIFDTMYEAQHWMEVENQIRA